MAYWTTIITHAHRKCKRHTHTTNDSTSDPTLQLNNPVYDGSTTVPHTTYSSHGPSYEVIDTNEGAGKSYDVMVGQSDHQNDGPNPQDYEVPAPPQGGGEEYSTLRH